MGDKARYTLRVDRLLLQKFRYVADAQGRSANREIEIYMKQRVKKYEDVNGEIPAEIMENDSSPTS